MYLAEARFFLGGGTGGGGGRGLGGEMAETRVSDETGEEEQPSNEVVEEFVSNLNRAGEEEWVFKGAGEEEWVFKGTEE